MIQFIFFPKFSWPAHLPAEPSLLSQRSAVELSGVAASALTPWGLSGSPKEESCGGSLLGSCSPGHIPRDPRFQLEVEARLLGRACLWPPRLPETLEQLEGQVYLVPGQTGGLKGWWDGRWRADDMKSPPALGQFLHSQARES